jgi:hypothetical protein
LLFGAILLAFYFFPVVIGFSLYFIILHSLKVLFQEFDFLKSEGTIKKISQFFTLLLPFTLVSIIGIALTLGAIDLFQLDVSVSIILIALVSSVTLPHSFVMEAFYRIKD